MVEGTERRVALLAPRASQAETEAARLQPWLRRTAPTLRLSAGLGAVPPDLAIVLGDGRFFLEGLARLPSKVPALCVGDGFLAEVPTAELQGALLRLHRNDYWVEERLRLEVRHGGQILPLALNDVSIIAARGGGFVRYALQLDGEAVWRDSGDGIVVATPTGSTGYCLSAGGPLVVENARAIVIVPICSSTQKGAIVVDEGSEIAIGDLQSATGCEVVVDGYYRRRARSGTVEIRRSQNPARLIHFGRVPRLRLFGRIYKRAGRARLPPEAPPSAKYLWKLLVYEGPMTQRDLAAESGLPIRTVRNALHYLIERDLVSRQTLLSDARQALFLPKR